MTANELFKRKDLYKRFDSIKKPKIWEKAGIELGLDIGNRKSGTHYTSLRNPHIKDHSNPESLVTTVQKNLYKQANQSIFKEVLKFGIKTGMYTEDDIWKALGML